MCNSHVIAAASDNTPQHLQIWWQCLFKLVHSTCSGFSVASPPGVRFFKRLCKVKILLSVKTVRPTVVVCFRKTRKGEKQLGGGGGGGGGGIWGIFFFANVSSIF